MIAKKDIKIGEEITIDYRPEQAGKSSQAECCIELPT